MKNLFCEINEGESIRVEKIVCILDADTATLSPVTRDFLKKNSEKGNAVNPKKPLSRVNSIILTNSFGEDRLYSSAARTKNLEKKLQDFLFRDERTN